LPLRARLRRNLPHFIASAGTIPGRRRRIAVILDVSQRGDAIIT
jgi:hypothetical protein